MVCEWSSEYIKTPIKVGDYIELGIYASYNGVALSQVNVVGTKSSAIDQHTFGSTNPGDDKWAGMPMVVATNDLVGTWNLQWSGYDAQGNVCTKQGGKLVINAVEIPPTCTGTFSMSVPDLTNINPLNPTASSNIATNPSSPVDFWVDGYYATTLSGSFNIDLFTLIKNAGVTDFSISHSIKAEPSSTNCEYYPSVKTVQIPELVIPCTGIFKMPLPDLTKIDPLNPVASANITLDPSSPIALSVDDKLVKTIASINAYKLDIFKLLSDANITKFDKEHKIEAEPTLSTCTFYPSVITVWIPALSASCIGTLDWKVPSLSNLNPLDPKLQVPINTTLSKNPGNISTSLPLGVYIDGIKVSTVYGNTTLDIISLLNKKYMPIDFTKSHTIEVRNESSCSITPASRSFTFPNLIGTPIPSPQIPSPPSCLPIWVCDFPLNGYEVNQCNTSKRNNTICNEPINYDARIVKILSNTQNLPDANEGESIPISATVVCKSGETTTKPRGTAYLIVDGATADEKQIENGIVNFEWMATAIPIDQHVICVKVPPGLECKSFGQDCKRIYVSPIILSIADQLTKERRSKSEQTEILKRAKQELRSSLISLELPTPELPVSLPTTGLPIPVSEPTTIINIPEYGNINIGTIPILIDPNTPIYLFIDNINSGRIYKLPKLIQNVSIGIHTVYIKAGIFMSPVTTIGVSKDMTTSIDL